MIIKEKEINNYLTSENNFIKTELRDLPQELITMIMSHLDFENLGSSATVSKCFYKNAQNCFSSQKKQIIDKESEDLKKLLSYIVDFIKSDEEISPEQKKTMINQLEEINIETFKQSKFSNVEMNGKSKIKTLQEMGKLDFYGYFFPNEMIFNVFNKIFEIINSDSYETNILLEAKDYFINPERYAAFFDAETYYLGNSGEVGFESFVSYLPDWIKEENNDQNINFFVRIALLMSKQHAFEHEKVNKSIVELFLNNDSFCEAGNYILELQYPKEGNCYTTISHFIQTVLSLKPDDIKELSEEKVNVIKKVIDLVDEELELRVDEELIDVNKADIHKVFQEKLIESQK